MRLNQDSTTQNAIENAPRDFRMRFFLQKAIETEEIWSLGNADGWVLKTDEDDKDCLSIWPLQDHARAMVKGNWIEQSPMAISLDHFVYDVLARLKNQDINIDIFPIDGETGEVVSARKLFDLLEGIIDAGEYYMEG